MSEHKKVGLNYDEVLEYIGQFGTFQRKVFLWMSLFSAAAGLAVVVFVFTGQLLAPWRGRLLSPASAMQCSGFVPRYRCSVPACGETPDTGYYDTGPGGDLALPSFYGVETIQLAERCRKPAVPRFGYFYLDV